MFYYKAFGLKICSVIKLLQVPESNFEEADIQILTGSVPLQLQGNYIDYQWIQIKKDEVLFFVENVASYYIKEGNTIIIEVEKNVPLENSALMQMYLMGTAMGALLIQRGVIPLHGSCIRRKDGLTILFTGESGAGKSTTAAYFLNRGWKLLSDDVTPIRIESNEIMVHPSFPQQKLWDDAVERQVLENNKARLLMKEDQRQKYAINSCDNFYDKREGLDIVIQLFPKEQPNFTCIEVNGVEKAILLREHTYRNFLYADNKSKQEHFQQCAKLAEHVKVFRICRPIGVETEKQIYETVEQILKEGDYE